MEVLCFGTYKLDLWDKRTLLLHDVLYASDIRQNLLSLVTLIRFGLKFILEKNSVFIFLGKTYYVYGYISDGFMILDVEYSIF